MRLACRSHFYDIFVAEKPIVKCIAMYACLFSGTNFEGSIIEVVWAKPVDKTDYARSGRSQGGFGRGIFPEVGLLFTSFACTCIVFKSRQHKSIYIFFSITFGIWSGTGGISYRSRTLRSTNFSLWSTKSCGFTSSSNCCRRQVNIQIWL